jgi:hypothetical protein
MRSTFGSDCQLLCINSSHDGQVEHQDNPWAPYVSYLKDVNFFLSSPLFLTGVKSFYFFNFIYLFFYIYSFDG